MKNLVERLTSMTLITGWASDPWFNKYVDFNGSFYSLKSNYSLDTNVPLVSG